MNKIQRDKDIKEILETLKNDEQFELVSELPEQLYKMTKLEFLCKKHNHKFLSDLTFVERKKSGKFPYYKIKCGFCNLDSLKIEDVKNLVDGFGYYPEDLYEFSGYKQVKIFCKHCGKSKWILPEKIHHDLKCCECCGDI